MDAVYVYKYSPNADFEIKYSLRSIAKYAPWINKVWIYGDKPSFCTDNTSILEHVRQDETARIINARLPISNFFLLLLGASLIPELSSEFLFLSDDFYFMRYFSMEDARQIRYLEDLNAIKERGTGAFIDAVWRTYDVIKRFACSGLSFETHAPTLMTKRWVQEAYTTFKDFVTQDRWYGILGLTAVLNHALYKYKFPVIDIIAENSRVGYWQTQPDKIEITKDTKFFNFDDGAFGPTIMSFLKEQFPEPSKYERIQ